MSKENLKISNKLLEILSNGKISLKKGAKPLLSFVVAAAIGTGIPVAANIKDDKATSKVYAATYAEAPDAKEIEKNDKILAKKDLSKTIDIFDLDEKKFLSIVKTYDNDKFNEYLKNNKGDYKKVEEYYKYASCYNKLEKKLKYVPKKKVDKKLLSADELKAFINNYKTYQNSNLISNDTKEKLEEQLIGQHQAVREYLKESNNVVTKFTKNVIKSEVASTLKCNPNDITEIKLRNASGKVDSVVYTTSKGKNYYLLSDGASNSTMFDLYDDIDALKSIDKSNINVQKRVTKTIIDTAVTLDQGLKLDKEYPDELVPKKTLTVSLKETLENHNKLSSIYSYWYQDDKKSYSK